MFGLHVYERNVMVTIATVYRKYIVHPFGMKWNDCNEIRGQTGRKQSEAA